MNTILIVLIVVVIYLMHTTSPKSEAFASRYSSNYNPGSACSGITREDCQKDFTSRMCKEKCDEMNLLSSS